MPALAESPLETLDINQALLDAIVGAAQKGLMMSGMKAKCVGVSRVPGKQTGQVTGMIGVHGSVSGFFTVNMPEQLAFQAVEGLLGEKFDKLSPQVIDGAGEVTNIIAGGVKAALANSDWAFSHITVPSVIVGGRLPSRLRQRPGIDRRDLRSGKRRGDSGHRPIDARDAFAIATVRAVSSRPR